LSLRKNLEPVLFRFAAIPFLKSCLKLAGSGIEAHGRERPAVNGGVNKARRRRVKTEVGFGQNAVLGQGAKTRLRLPPNHPAVVADVCARCVSAPLVGFSPKPTAPRRHAQNAATIDVAQKKQHRLFLFFTSWSTFSSISLRV
jgi:hypothetical protein